MNQQVAERQGEYFWKDLAVDNSQGGVYQGVTNIGMLPNGRLPIIGATNSGTVFVPAATENFDYDADGNLTADSRWIYTWDAENRLAALETVTNTPAANLRRIEYEYDYQGRRMAKQVYKWVTAAWELDSARSYVYDGWNLVAELDPDAQLLASYTWGLDLSGSLQGAGSVGGLLMVETEGYPLSFVSYDGSGNVTALYDS